MSEKLAKRVIADIPVSQLQQVVSSMSNLPKTVSAESGGVCGCSCDGDGGYVCGLGCAKVSRATVGVVDQAGQLGMTKTELIDIRGKVMGFKDTLLSQARISGIPLK